MDNLTVRCLGGIAGHQRNTEGSPFPGQLESDDSGARAEFHCAQLLDASAGKGGL